MEMTNKTKATIQICGVVALIAGIVALAVILAT